MKTLTVSLLLCTMMALIQAFVLPGYHNESLAVKDSQPDDATGLPQEPASTDGDMVGMPWGMPSLLGYRYYWPEDGSDLPGEPASTDSYMWGMPWGIPSWLKNMYSGWFPHCPDGWSMHSQQCLLFVPTNLTWEEANNNCGFLGGQLASVCNEIHAEEMHQMTQQAGYDHGQFWVGGYNTPESPSWSWSNEMPCSAFADFCDEEEHEHCLQITIGEGMKECLDDMKCEAELPSICGYILI